MSSQQPDGDEELRATYAGAKRRIAALELQLKNYLEAGDKRRSYVLKYIVYFMIVYLATVTLQPVPLKAGWYVAWSPCLTRSMAWLTSMIAVELWRRTWPRKRKHQSKLILFPSINLLTNSTASAELFRAMNFLSKIYQKLRKSCFQWKLMSWWFTFETYVTCLICCASLSNHCSSFVRARAVLGVTMRPIWNQQLSAGSLLSLCTPSSYYLLPASPTEALSMTSRVGSCVPLSMIG